MGDYKKTSGGENVMIGRISICPVCGTVMDHEEYSQICPECWIKNHEKVELVTKIVKFKPEIIDAELLEVDEK